MLELIKRSSLRRPRNSRSLSCHRSARRGGLNTSRCDSREANRKPHAVHALTTSVARSSHPREKVVDGYPSAPQSIRTARAGIYNGVSDKGLKVGSPNTQDIGWYQIQRRYARTLAGLVSCALRACLALKTDLRIRISVRCATPLPSCIPY